jgi:hypothetical protein
MLKPDEIGQLVKQLQDETDPKRAAKLKERLTRGFYGS